MLSKIAKGKRFESFAVNAIIVACFITALVSSNNGTTVLVNMVTLLVMYVFLRKGIGKRKKQTPSLYSLRSLTRDLTNASNRIRELDSHDIEAIRDVLHDSEDAPFESEAFKTTIKEYFDESDALVRRGKTYYNCNIADYINEDLLNSVGNSAYNEFISNVMTGLGILGTFVGLAIGLQSFHTDSAEAMTNSIAPLIEGIKVAFYTSIFGVLLSLVYGTIYKYRFNKAETAAEEFVGLFYRYCGYRPENEAVSRLLQLQEDQTDSMNQFAEEISIALADAIDKALAPTLSQLPDQMSQAIQSNIAPTMQSISDSIHTLADELTDNITQAQRTGVEDIVDSFLEQMDRAVGGQMENLEKSIQTICDWQQTTSEKLDEVIESVCQNAESVSVINEDLKDIVTQLASYIASMDSAAEKLHTATECVGQLAQRTEDAVENYQNILDQSAQISEQIEKQQKEAAELAIKQSELMRSDSDFIQNQSEQLKKTCEGVTENFDEAAGHLATVSGQLKNDVSEAMTQTYAQFDSQLAKAITHFSGTLSELRDIVEKTPKIVDSLSVSMKKDVAEYLGAVQNSQKELTATITNTTSQLTEHIQELDTLLNSMLNKVQTDNAISNPEDTEVKR